jgi:hypothetical protein
MLTTSRQRSAAAFALLLVAGISVTACTAAPPPRDALPPRTASASPIQDDGSELNAELSSWRRDWSAHFCDASVLALGDQPCLELELEAVVLADRAISEISLSDASENGDTMHALAKTNDAVAAYRSSRCDVDRVSACDELGARLGTAIKELATAFES